MTEARRCCVLRASRSLPRLRPGEDVPCPQRRGRPACSDVPTRGRGRTSPLPHCPRLPGPLWPRVVPVSTGHAGGGWVPQSCAEEETSARSLRGGGSWRRPRPAHPTRSLPGSPDRESCPAHPQPWACSRAPAPAVSVAPARTACWTTTRTPGRRGAPAPWPVLGRGTAGSHASFLRREQQGQPLAG